MTSDKREKTSQKKKERILHTTMQLLLKKGSSISTSTTDICTTAKLTRPSLYHYFGSKRNLLLSVHMDSIEKTLRPYLDQAASIADPMARLTFMVRTFTKDVICLHPELRVLIHDSLTMKDKYFREVKGEWKRHYVLLRETIVQLQSQGQINPEIRPSWASLFVLGMLTWTTYWLDYGRKDEVDKIADLALQLVLHGLGMKDEPYPG
jgi:TetR/AcrR family transcriptional regulator, cholesterol catabolism regulator